MLPARRSSNADEPFDRVDAELQVGRGVNEMVNPAKESVGSFRLITHQRCQAENHREQHPEVLGHEIRTLSPCSTPSKPANYCRVASAFKHRVANFVVWLPP